MDRCVVTIGFRQLMSFYFEGRPRQTQNMKGDHDNTAKHINNTSR